MTRTSQKQRLQQLLNPLDGAPVECDGMSRLVLTVLHRERIPYQAYFGQILLDGKAMRPHFWIESQGFRIDYRSRMWFKGDERLAHGVFEPHEGQGHYVGHTCVLEPLSDKVFEVLRMPIPSLLFGKIR